MMKNSKEVSVGKDVNSDSVFKALEVGHSVYETTTGIPQDLKWTGTYWLHPRLRIYLEKTTVGKRHELQPLLQP